MRILITTTQDRFFLSHILGRAVYFKNKGNTVAVAAQKTSDELVKKIELSGLTFYDTGIERQSLNPITQIKALLNLFNIHREFCPDVSYHLGAKSIFYGTLISRLFNSNVAIINAPIGLGFVFASDTIKANLLRPFVLFLYKLFLNPARSKVIVENWDDINFFIKKGYLRPKDSFCILGAGVNTDVFCPIPFEDRNDICTVIMASRLIKEKGVWDFINAARRLKQLGVPVRMQLVGEPDFGNPSSLTKEEFLDLCSSTEIECLGYRSNMVPVLQKAHICCLPSYYREGLPKILIEAASVGLAILTTDTIGCKEAVKDNNGYLFPPHDIDKMVELIQFLAKNPQEMKRLGQNSRRVAKAYFDSALINKRTYDLIKSLFN